MRKIILLLLPLLLISCGGSVSTDVNIDIDNENIIEEQACSGCSDEALNAANNMWAMIVDRLIDYIGQLADIRLGDTEERQLAVNLYLTYQNSMEQLMEGDDPVEVTTEFTEDVTRLTE